MRVLVSCRRCKRAVLIAGSITGGEMVKLQHHLAECGSSDRFDPLRVEDVLRHFRTVTIEPEEGTERVTEMTPRVLKSGVNTAGRVV